MENRYCKNCQERTKHREKLDATQSGYQVCNECNSMNYDSNWKLVRLQDGLTKYSSKIIWMEWDENGKAVQTHEEPKKGYSLIMDPLIYGPGSYHWQTTTITDISENSDEVIKFKTMNSNYELWRI